MLSHFNMDNMREAFNALKWNKASGIEGISKKIYSNNLEANLNDLLSRIRKGSYKPQNKKKVLIPQRGIY